LPDDAVPVELSRFVSEHVESYEQLEVLLWLNSHRDESHEPSLLAEKLGMPESLLDEALQALVSAKLLVRIGNSPELMRCAPATSEISEKIRALAEYYQRNRLQVVRLMTESSMRRLRGSALQAFADCFLLGKPGKRG
jgi:hypothetical protein